jgi:hypothetical protein
MAAARRLFKEGSREEVAAALVSEYSGCIKTMTTPKNTLASLDTFWRKVSSRRHGMHVYIHRIGWE